MQLCQIVVAWLCPLNWNINNSEDAEKKQLQTRGANQIIWCWVLQVKQIDRTINMTQTKARALQGSALVKFKISKLVKHFGEFAWGQPG